MKRYLLVAVLIITGCNAGIKIDEDLQTRLKFSMQDYLYKSVNYDSGKVKYKVEEVVYYDDARGYDCEFKVRMTTKGIKDTLGIMRAQISKDFKKVDRIF
jgi:hypothetical protein